MVISKSDYAILDKDWFIDQLVDQRLIQLAESSFGAIHGQDRNREVTTKIIEKNLDESQVKKCRTSLENLEKVVPKEFSNLIRLCANTYANICDEVIVGLDNFYYASIESEWMLHSNSAFKGKRYRDHLTHQTQVSLFGCELLDSEGALKINLVDDIINALKKTTKLDSFLSTEGINEDLINKDIINASWIVGSLFHDLGYCFLSFIKSQQLISEISGIFETNVLEEIWNKASYGIKEHSYLVEFYKDYGEGLDQNSSFDEVKNIIKKSMLESPNHSVVGALYLLEFIRKIEDDDSSPFKLDHEFKKKMLLVFELAAMAILSHDLDCEEKRNSLSGDKIFKDNFKVPFEHYPMSYLLGVCDQIQEWGRVRFVRVPKGEDECVEKHLIDCTEAQIKLNEKTKVLEIRYIIPDDRSSDYTPSFTFLNAKVKNNGNKKQFKSIQEFYNEFPEGKLSILNDLYGKSPVWDSCLIYLEVGGAVFTALDFFADAQTKNILSQNLYK